MFETAELDHRISKKEWRERVPLLREELLEAQVRLRELGLRVVVLVVRNRRGRDPVDSFRRQIDALGPEARRPTIDKVRLAEEDSGETGENDS